VSQGLLACSKPSRIPRVVCEQKQSSKLSFPPSLSRSLAPSLSLSLPLSLPLSLSRARALSLSFRCRSRETHTQQIVRPSRFDLLIARATSSPKHGEKGVASERPGVHIPCTDVHTLLQQIGPIQVVFRSEAGQRGR
jgi:hypothetical protein